MSLIYFLAAFAYAAPFSEVTPSCTKPTNSTICPQNFISCETSPGFTCPTGQACERVPQTETECQKLVCKPMVKCTREAIACSFDSCDFGSKCEVVGEIEKIQQELKQLSQKQVELSKSHQQRVKSHEEHKTLYQHLFGQSPLQPDPELQALLWIQLQLGNKKYQAKVSTTDCTYVAQFRGDIKSTFKNQLAVYEANELTPLKLMERQKLTQKLK